MREFLLLQYPYNVGYIEQCFTVRDYEKLYDFVFDHDLISYREH